MKNRLKSIAISIVFLIPFVAPWEGGSTSNVGQATKGILFAQAAIPMAANFMPVLDWTMSDLDVRDAQNNSVVEAGAAERLAALFTQNLFEQAVIRDLHIVGQVWEGLNSFSRLFHNLFLHLVYPLWESIPKVWAPSTKRLVHNVYNVWITLSVGLLLGFLTVLKFSENSSCQRLILRC
jgi:hypothetical protein